MTPLGEDASLHDPWKGHGTDFLRPGGETTGLIGGLLCVQGRLNSAIA